MDRGPLTETARLVWQLISIACLMVVGMTIYETAKHLIDPTITIWESHVTTILFK